MQAANGKDRKKIQKGVDKQSHRCYNKYSKKEKEWIKMETKYDRWHLLDQVITKFGFETEETIDFAFLCENGNDKQIAETFEKLMK